MLPARSASRGNSAKTLSSVHGSARSAAVGGGRDQIFARGEIGKYLAALGHEADAELGDAVGGQVADVGAVEPDRARGRRRQAHDRAHRRGLAHAVAAEQRHHFAGRDRKRDAEQHPAQAVAGLDAGQLRAAASVQSISHGGAALPVSPR